MSALANGWSRAGSPRTFRRDDPGDHTGEYPPGTFFLLAVADRDKMVLEGNEGNNTRSASIEIQNQ